MGQPVDVRRLNEAPLAFQFHAVSGQLLLTRNERLSDEFRARAWDLYLDFKPVAMRHLREVLSG